MKNVRSICVFCGSRIGVDPDHRKVGEALGHLMAERGIRLIYGGGGIGMMAVTAQAVMERGGSVTGVIPQFLLEYEVGNVDGVETEVVDSMHTRKARMFELSDAFVILPGGLGTLDEACEILTWKQLQRHDRPVVFVNINGYWDPFMALIDQVVDGGYGHHKVRDLFSFATTAEEIFEAIANAPQPDKIVLTSHL